MNPKTIVEMVTVPSGEITLRDNRKQKQWTSQIASFQIGQYPVTQALYAEVMGDNPSAFSGERHPVENVSWNDAILFCNKLSRKLGLNECYSISPDGEEVTWDKEADGFRLATDAEWEYACRAGTGKVIYGEIDAIAWYEGNSEEKTHPVGEKEPNPWGIYDMLGNVWEWCWDLYDEEVYGTYRVFRGGGWFDPERGCLASNRRRSHPTYQIEDLGFRVARAL